MAFTTSYVNGAVIAQILAGGTANLDTDTVSVHLYTDSITTQDKNTAEGIVATATQPYGTTARVSYSGATPAGAGSLTNPTLTTGSGKIIFGDSAATLAWTGASFTTRGCVVWDDTVTTPTADPVLCAINFGSDITVSANTFTITWDATNKIFYATY